MKMTNSEIYVYATALIDHFKDANQRLPIKINFYLQKNKTLLFSLAREIEEGRTEIIKNYAVESDDKGNFKFDDNEKYQNALQEINDLLNLEQEVQIYKFKIEDFPEDLILTTAQMEALMFMIE